VSRIDLALLKQTVTTDMVVKCRPNRCFQVSMLLDACSMRRSRTAGCNPHAAR